MKVLDIDMDYFLDTPPVFIPDTVEKRASSEQYKPWEKEMVKQFFEKNLGLTKDKNIKGKIVTHHNESLYYWRELIRKEKLRLPFDVVHVDSHADLGLGYPSWTFIFESLLGLDVDKRMEIEKYRGWFKNKTYYEPSIGDYLLFALAFRWISKLTYVSHPSESGDDYLWMILKDLKEPNDKIQLPYNKDIPAVRILREQEQDHYLKTAILEPEVDFEIIRKPDDVLYNGEFDYITFCISPNYTPETADFIIDMIKDYIKEEPV